MTIGSNVFDGCVALKTLDLPNAETIGDSAFRDCEALTEVNIPSAVTIGSNVFDGCVALKTLNISSLENVPDNMFKGHASLETVLMTNTKTIGESAFEGCTALKTVDISGVESIGEAAFFECIALTDLYLGNVSSIGQDAVAGCISLVSIRVDPSNTYYCSPDDVLFDIGQKELIQYPAMKAGDIYTVPKTVTLVHPWAFFRCENLTSISVEEENNDFSSKYGALFNKDGTELMVCPSGKDAFEITSEVKTVSDLVFTGRILKEITIASNTNVHFMTDSIYGCENLDKITIHDNTGLTFDNHAIKHLHPDTKQLYVIAHVHDCIPDHALHNIAVMYGSHVASGSNTGGSEDNKKGTTHDVTDDTFPNANSGDAAKYDPTSIVVVVICVTVLVNVLSIAVIMRRR